MHRQRSDMQGCFNHNHQLNWWYALALKGPRTCKRLKTRRIDCQPHLYFRRRLKALFYCLRILATRERVYLFFQRYLIIGNVFLKLVPYVFLYRFFVPPHSVNIVAPTPEMPVAIPVFHICMPVKNHERTFALYISHDLSNAVLWRNADQHVDMIRTQLRLDYFYSLLIAQLSYDLSYVAFDLSVDYLSPILRRKYYVVMTSPF